MTPREILVGDRLQLKPAEGETATASETAPAKPLKPATVTVEFPIELDETLTLVGFAVMVKSWTMKVTIVLWLRPPSEPVTVSAYEPVVPEQDNTDVPLVTEPVSVMLVGETLQLRPLEGEMVIDNEIVPARP
jgi:hypothetical protein